MLRWFSTPPIFGRLYRPRASIPPDPPDLWKTPRPATPLFRCNRSPALTSARRWPFYGHATRPTMKIHGEAPPVLPRDVPSSLMGIYPCTMASGHGLPTPTIDMIIHITGDDVAATFSLLHRPRPWGTYNPPDMHQWAGGTSMHTPPWRPARCARRGDNSPITYRQEKKGSSTTGRTGEALPPWHRWSFCPDNHYSTTATFHTPTRI